MAYTLLNYQPAQGIIREYFGQIAIGGSASIDSNTAHDVYLVLFGAWNASGVTSGWYSSGAFVIE